MASEASDEVEVRWRSMMALDLPPAPANIRRNHYDNKAEFMEDLATRYNQFADSEETEFGAFQLAIFFIASPACAKDLKFFVNGSYRLKVAETVVPSEQPSGQDETPCVVESTAVEPTASSFFDRALGSVWKFAHHRLASSPTPPEQPTASSEPAPDPQPSTRRGLRSLKRKRSHSNTTRSTLPDTVSSVVNRPKTVRPRRSSPTARTDGDPRSDEYWDPDLDIVHPDQDKIDQKIYEEYLQRQFKSGITDPNF